MRGPVLRDMALRQRQPPPGIRSRPSYGHPKVRTGESSSRPGFSVAKAGSHLGFGQEFTSTLVSSLYSSRVGLTSDSCRPSHEEGFFGRPGTAIHRARIEACTGSSSRVAAPPPHHRRPDDPASQTRARPLRAQHRPVACRRGLGHPADECTGRGEAIRKAREAGLETARLNRLARHRAERDDQTNRGPADVV